jgi:tRNA U38,U39,U40 pseudouridine synthase TruA
MSQVTNQQYAREVKKFIRLGMSAEQIFYKLRIEHCPQNIEEALLKVVVDQTCDNYPDYELIQAVVRSKLAVDRDSDSSKVHAIDHLKKTIVELDKHRVSKLFDSKYEFRDRIYTCKFEYMPLNYKMLVKDEGLWKFNTYNAPFWQTDTFYSQGEVPIPKVAKLPKLYQVFLEHLVDGDKGSFNYVLDWMANALQDRNYCILTTIGNQGVGKGVLGAILNRLVGEHNFTATDKKLIRKDFNGQIYGKRIVYIDEVKISNADEENKLKSLINDTIEIEMKGKDAILTKNYASIYMSSNQLNSLRLTADDRRFSIVNLTSKKLYETLTPDEINALLEPDNIQQLAQYLFYRKVDDKQMLKVFKSSRTEEVRSNQLNSWQEWFLEEFCFEYAGQTVLVKDATDAVVNEFGPSYKCSRQAFKVLSDLYPDKFVVKSPRKEVALNGKKVRKTMWCLEIHKWEDEGE